MTSTTNTSAIKLTANEKQAIRDLGWDKITFHKDGTVTTRINILYATDINKTAAAITEELRSAGYDIRVNWDATNETDDCIKVNFTITGRNEAHPDARIEAIINSIKAELTA